MIIKLFEEFTNDHSEINEICDKYGIRNYTINSDGSIDVNGNVNLNDKGLTKLPLKFNKVGGSVNFYFNLLTTLEGSPVVVGGDFICSNNKLTSLEGCPKKVGGDFYCSHNQLTSFEGIPDNFNVGDYFDCGDNPIYELWILFEDYKHIELFNDLDIVRDYRTIVLQRLNEFLDMIGKPRVTEVKGYKCI